MTLQALFVLSCSASSAADHTVAKSAAPQSTKPLEASTRAPVPSIEVREHLGVTRKRWPIRASVPFPSGAVRDVGDLQVVSEDGPIPAQLRPLAKWADGSVRWVLVDVRVDLSPRERRHLRLQPGKSPPPSPALSVKETETSVEVDTGAMRFAIPKHSFAPLQSLVVRGRPAPTEPMRAFLEDADGGRVEALAPESVIVEERGPLRAQVALRGRYSNGFAYVIRLQAFAEQPFVRILHTFVNRRDSSFTMLNRIALELPIRFGKSVGYEAGVEGHKPREAVVPSAGVLLAQTDNQSFHVGRSQHGGHLSGWFKVWGDGAAVGLDAPFFWQEYPQSVFLRPDGLTYDLWSKGGGQAKVEIGAAKTHELLLIFEDPKQAKALVQEPGRGTLAFVDPTWTAHTGALLNAVAPSRAAKLLSAVHAAFARYARSIQRERWDDSGQVQCPAPEHERPRTGQYGMFNWGDWNYPGYHDRTKGCDAWGNQEYDLTQVLALLFAATGDPEVHQFLVAAARHFTDVDRIHYLPLHPTWVGMNHPKNPLHFSFELGGVDLGHTWVEGLFSYYFLTGDEAARDGAVGIADYLTARLRSPLKGNPRQFGWPALALAAAFSATGEARYRDAALDYARRGMQAHPPSEVLKQWKMGILAEALTYVHAVTGDESIRAWLLAYAKIVSAQRPRDVRYYPALAYLGSISEDTSLRNEALAAAGSIDYGSWGKPFTVGARCAFRIESLRR